MNRWKKVQLLQSYTKCNLNPQTCTLWVDQVRSKLSPSQGPIIHSPIQSKAQAKDHYLVVQPRCYKYWARTHISHHTLDNGIWANLTLPPKEEKWCLREVHQPSTKFSVRFKLIGNHSNNKAMGPILWHKIGCDWTMA